MYSNQLIDDDGRVGGMGRHGDVVRWLEEIVNRTIHTPYTPYRSIHPPAITAYHHTCNTYIHSHTYNSLAPLPPQHPGLEQNSHAARAWIVPIQPINAVGREQGLESAGRKWTKTDLFPALDKSSM